MQAYRTRPGRRAPAHVKVNEHRRRSTGAWLMFAASLCPVLGVMLVDLGGFVPLAIAGAALGALGAWWFTIPFHAEPRIARVARWGLRVTALAVLGCAVATTVGEQESAMFVLFIAALLGATLKLAYLRVYFVAHSNAKARAAGLAAMAYVVSVLATLLAVFTGPGGYDITPIAALLCVLAFGLFVAAWITSDVLLVAAARAARLSRVEWWLSEKALPDHDWAALIWHGLEAAQVFEPDGNAIAFPSAFDAVNWLAARSFVDRDTAVARQLVTTHEVPPQSV